MHVLARQLRHFKPFTAFLPRVGTAVPHAMPMQLDLRIDLIRAMQPARHLPPSVPTRVDLIWPPRESTSGMHTDTSTPLRMQRHRRTQSAARGANLPILAELTLRDDRSSFLCSCLSSLCLKPSESEPLQVVVFTMSVCSLGHLGDFPELGSAVRCCKQRALHDGVGPAHEIRALVTSIRQARRDQAGRRITRLSSAARRQLST